MITRTFWRPSGGCSRPPATWSGALLTARHCARPWPHCSRTSSWWIFSFRQATASRFAATSNQSHRKRQSSLSALPLTRESAREHFAPGHSPLLRRSRQSTTCGRPFKERWQRELIRCPRAKPTVQTHDCMTGNTSESARVRSGSRRFMKRQRIATRNVLPLRGALFDPDASGRFDDAPAYGHTQSRAALPR